MNLSIIEFGVYGFITYVSLLMLIISTINPPKTERINLYRSIYLIPGIICAVILANAGLDINLDTIETTKETWDNQTSTLIFSEYTTTTDKFILVDPIWVMVHYMIFIIMTVYLIIQILTLFTKWNE